MSQDAARCNKTIIPKKTPLSSGVSGLFEIRLDSEMVEAVGIEPTSATLSSEALHAQVPGLYDCDAGTPATTAWQLKFWLGRLPHLHLVFQGFKPGYDVHGKQQNTGRGLLSQLRNQSEWLT